MTDLQPMKLRVSSMNRYLARCKQDGCATSERQVIRYNEDEKNHLGLE